MENKVLLIPDLLETGRADITSEEGRATADILAGFVRSYRKKDEDVSDEDWLLTQFKVSMSDRDEAELTQMRDEIIDGVRCQEEAKKSLDTALSNGMSKESWFVRECKKATSAMSTIDSSKYLRSLDDAVSSANENLWATILTKGGDINQNPSLDGFIAEEWHAQTFNLSAVAKGSPYRAEVLKPDGTRYGKNSVDIQVKNIQTGEIVDNYQSKYYKDANATGRALVNGDYQGQQGLIPSDQKGQIDGKYTNVLRSPDGITSLPLTKEAAKKLQVEAQSGNWNEWNWDKYVTRDLVVGIAKKTMKSGAMGLCCGVGFELGRQILNDEEIDVEKVVDKGIKSGADFGIKTALSGGLKVAVEKGALSILPKGISGNACTAIAFTAVENVKVLGQVASGELTPMEGFEKSEQVTASCICGLVAAGKGASIGSTVGMVLGPIGATVGGFVGGIVGYMAGSGFGEKVVKGYQKVRKVVVEKVVKPAWEKAKNAVHKTWEGIKSIGRALNPLNWF